MIRGTQSPYLPSSLAQNVPLSFTQAEGSDQSPSSPHSHRGVGPDCTWGLHLGSPPMDGAPRATSLVMEQPEEGCAPHPAMNLWPSWLGGWD